MAIPSLADAKNRRRTKAHIRHTMSIHNLLSDPFGISTLTICSFSWIIALGGSSATVADNESFPRFSWWGLAYQFVIIVIMTILYCFDIVSYYKNFTVGSNCVAFVYNTNSATNLLYSDGSRIQAATSGYILMAIINFSWIFYFGGDNASPVNRWLDSYSIRGIKPSAQEDALLRAHKRSTNMLGRSRSMKMVNYETDTNIPINYNNNTNNYNYNNNESEIGINLREDPVRYISSTELNGLENYQDTRSIGIPAEISNEPSESDTKKNSTISYTLEDREENKGNTFSTGISSNNNTQTTFGFYSDMYEETFPYKALALYSYDASASDAYEISFDEGEILQVSDIEGRWWKARRADGTTGIIPSNYVKLINQEEEEEQDAML